MSSTGNWLSISPSGSLNTVSNPSLTVSVIQSALSSLTVGSYSGTITLVANGVTQTVQVTLVVSTSGSGGGTGNVTAYRRAALSFTYTVGGTTPVPQTLQVTSASGSAPVSFTDLEQRHLAFGGRYQWHLAEHAGDFHGQPL